MTESQFKSSVEWKKLQTLRDELALKAHLMKAEVKAEWEDLDKKWTKAKSEVDTVISAADKTRQDISVSASAFLNTFTDGFDKIRKTLIG